MNILLLTNSFEKIVNGPAKFANILLQINTLYPGYQIRVLTEDISAEKLLQTKYVYKVALNYPFYLRPLGQFLRMFIYYKRAREIEKEYSYDLLLYINAFNGLWGAMVSEKPVAGMINDDNNLTATFSDFSFNLMFIKRLLFKQLERWSLKYHTFIISNSDYMTSQLVKAYQLPPSRIHRLYKAVQLSHFIFQPGRAFSLPVKVLFVKADYMRGGLPILAKALQQLSHIHFSLTIIGPHTRFGKHIQSLFENSGHIQVNFLAEQAQSVVYECMYTHDIFCVPSLREALGVANIEALASGIPVVSTSTGGIPEVLDYGKNGWLAKPGDVTSLAAQLSDCIADQAGRKQKSALGRKFIEKFSDQHMLSTFLNIVEHAGKFINT